MSVVPDGVIFSHIQPRREYARPDLFRNALNCQSEVRQRSERNSLSVRANVDFLKARQDVGLSLWETQFHCPLEPSLGRVLVQPICEVKALVPPFLSEPAGDGGKVSLQIGALGVGSVNGVLKQLDLLFKQGYALLRPLTVTLEFLSCACGSLNGLFEPVGSFLPARSLLLKSGHSFPHLPVTDLSHQQYHQKDDIGGRK